MKAKGLIALVVLALLLAGVSCSNEKFVSDKNISIKGRGLEKTGVKYQYAVTKGSGSNETTVVDWTEFDIDSGFSVQNLSSGSYTFSVRGTTLKGAIMYFGSTTCFLPRENHDGISIVLYPQIDESNLESTLSIDLLSSTTSNNTANCLIKGLGSLSEVVKRVELSKCDTGFSSTSISLVPGYYEVSTFVYQDGVEVGGNFEIVFVPTGYSKTLEIAINPRSFEGFVDISKNATLSVKKGDVVTLAYVGNGGESDSNGFWFITDKIVEDNATYYTVDTSTEGTFTVEFYRGTLHKSCTVTIASSQQTVTAYIMNFRCADFTSGKPCIGYKYSDGTMFPVIKTQVSAGSNYNQYDYTTLNLTPVYGNLNKATFAEVKEADWIKSFYGQDWSNNNTTVKKMIIWGDLPIDRLSNKFTALEELLLVGPENIDLGSLANLTSLKTVYIIPPQGGVVSISKNVFTGSAVEKVVVFGTESQMSFPSKWKSGSDLTKENFVYNATLPL